jgi:hypothetical protein
MKKLNITSLATTGALLIVLVTSVTACGQSIPKSSVGSQPASHDTSQSSPDELQRWNARYQPTPEGDELQRWAAKYPNVKH